MSESDNPLIKKTLKVIPPTTIRLPSKGMFYTDNELNDEVSNGEMLLHPMTTLDEIIIRSPDMLLQGTAIEKIITRCAPQVKKPLHLFSKDVDYILIQLHKLSYGDNRLINFTCPICQENAPENEITPTHQYPLSINYFIQRTKELEQEDRQKYRITLSNEMVVNLRPSRYIEMLKMYQLNDETKSPEEQQDIIIQSVLSVIDNVDNTKNREHIGEWLELLPIKFMQEIIDKISDANDWGPDFKYEITCRDCKSKQDISYLINPVSFFMLPSSPKTVKN